MQISTTSSERTAAAGSIASLTRDSPLVSLSGFTGRGEVLLKLDGCLAGGSMWDRVGRWALDGSPKRRAVCAGLGPWAASYAAVCSARGVALRVLMEPEDSPRLLALVRRLGARIERVAHASEALPMADELLLDPAAPHPFAAALLETAAEALRSRDDVEAVVAASLQPDCPDLRALLGEDIAFVLLQADRGESRSLAAPHQALRERVAREAGVLLGPTATEVVARAIAIAEQNAQVVCAVIPDGGHRYLGWW
jgi:cysteine synthase